MESAGRAGERCLGKAGPLVLHREAQRVVHLAGDGQRYHPLLGVLQRVVEKVRQQPLQPHRRDPDRQGQVRREVGAQAKPLGGRVPGPPPLEVADQLDEPGLLQQRGRHVSSRIRPFRNGRDGLVDESTEGFP